MKIIKSKKLVDRTITDGKTFIELTEGLVPFSRPKEFPAYALLVQERCGDFSVVISSDKKSPKDYYFTSDIPLNLNIVEQEYNSLN